VSLPKNRCCFTFSDADILFETFFHEGHLEAELLVFHTDKKTTQNVLDINKNEQT